MIFNNLSKNIQLALSKEGLTTPTAIQKLSIPFILDKKDVVGIAQTGTGKTAAFLLPLLHLLESENKQLQRKQTRALILSPTRELVLQISEAITKYSKHLNITHTAIYGGVSQDPQVKAIYKGVDIIVATPGRLQDIISQDRLDLSKTEYFVVDEAHIMLNMGFVESVKEISAQLAPNKQSAFFTATTSPEVLSLSKELLRSPDIIEIEPEKASNSITQKVCFVYVENKNALLLELIRQTEKTIIFLRTRYKSDVIQKLLLKNNITTGIIHSDKTQEERNQAIQDFKSNKIRVLVSTDIAARGIHIDDISSVINYDVPNSPDVYVHRIGRTARAGKSGIAYSFCGLEEREYIRNIEKYTGQEMEIVKSSFHADKIQHSTAKDIQNKPKRRKGSNQNMGQKRVKTSDIYVPPINKKKGKKPRGLSKDPKTGKYKK